jgi:hypothetical protein
MGLSESLVLLFRTDNVGSLLESCYQLCCIVGSASLCEKSKLDLYTLETCLTSINASLERGGKSRLMVVSEILAPGRLSSLIKLV